MDEILAECDDDDDIEMDSDTNDNDTKSARKNNSSRVYLNEDEDSIIDFTSPSANKNITCMFFIIFFHNKYTKKNVENGNSIYFGQHFLNIFSAVKPDNNQTTAQAKLQKRKENEFPTAPDGRLIILENKSEKPAPKRDVNSGMYTWLKFAR